MEINMTLHLPRDAATVPVSRQAVADNLRLSGDDRQGTIVHFEKTLEWLPGAAGEHLITADSGR